MTRRNRGFLTFVLVGLGIWMFRSPSAGATYFDWWMEPTTGELRWAPGVSPPAAGWLPYRGSVWESGGLWP